MHSCHKWFLDWFVQNIRQKYPQAANAWAGFTLLTWTHTNIQMANWEAGRINVFLVVIVAFPANIQICPPHPSPPSGSVQANDLCFSVEVKFGRNGNPNGKFIMRKATLCFTGIHVWQNKKKKQHLLGTRHSFKSRCMGFLILAFPLYLLGKEHFQHRNTFSIINYGFRVFKD